MLLKPGDRIRVTLTQASATGVLGDPSMWSNVTRIEVDSKVAGYTLTPGREIQAVVERIDDQTAYVTQKPGSYARHTSPGDYVEVTIDEMVVDSVGEATLDGDSQLDRVIAPNVTPGATVRVEVIKVREKLAVGRVTETLDPGISEGDVIRARTSSGETVVTPLEGEFEVDTEHEAMCDTEVAVELDSIGSPSSGTITDYGDLPVVGTTCTARVTEGETRATAKNGGFVVSLDEPALLSGTATVRITDRSNGQPSGTISDYRGDLPSEGEHVVAKVYSHNRTANPAAGRYTIQLRGQVEQSGEASIRITEVSDRIVGTVQEYEEVDEDTSDGVVGSKNSLLDGTSF